MRGAEAAPGSVAVTSLVAAPGSVAAAGMLVGGMVLGCQGPPSQGIEQPWSWVREVRGDSALVRTTGGSVWGDTMTLAPGLAIGKLDGEEPYLLGLVAGLDVDGSGRVYVLDRQAQNLRVFSPDEAHLQTIGRGGQGPGEFQTPDCVRITSEGERVVRDAPSRFPSRPMRTGA